MTKRIIGFLCFFGLCDDCCTNSLLIKLSEALFRLFGVSPHCAKYRDLLDWYYLALIAFNNIYMGLLGASLFFDEIPDELISYLVFVVPNLYIALTVTYTAAISIQNASLLIKKKRGGQIIILQWLAFAVALTLFTTLTNRASFDMVEPAMMTFWLISLFDVVHLLVAKWIRTHPKVQAILTDGNGGE